MSPASTAPIRDMFDDLVPGYDQFNAVSSLGLDARWRKETARIFGQKELVLDVGTGTGDLANSVASNGADVIGIDFALNMVKAAQAKFAGNKKLRFQVAEADNLPFKANKFDGVVSAFVIRNLNHGGILGPAFREFHRVLKKDGRMVHLELTRPPKGLMSWGHRQYLSRILPVVGKLMFGRRWPQNYLSKTIKEFPVPSEVCQRMRWAGFDRICHYSLSGGIAGLFVGERCSN